MEKPSKNLKKTPAKKPKTRTDSKKETQKPKVAPRRKASSNKTINLQNNRIPPPTRAESQHAYYEVLGSRIANRAYELYVQRGHEHGHDLEDWLEAERQILPKEISARS
jgi:hypothetical protein